MRLNAQKKHFIRRMAGYATNPVQSKIRTVLGREQHLDVDGIPIVLPPDHDLPFYQRRDPTYDAYAITLLAQLASAFPVTVVDVGANVGDTAAAVLASAPGTEVISVEGDARFVDYLRRNMAPYPDRARVVDRFVGPVGTQAVYSRTGTTGGFNTVGSSGSQQVADWVTPADLLAMVAPDRTVVWKSDIDGFDIHVLTGHWSTVVERSAVVWFEYDPARTLGDPADIPRLIELISQSGRTTLVHDNLGRLITRLEPGRHQTAALHALTDWLLEQRSGFVTVPYLDLWLLTPEAVTALDQE